MLDDWRCQPCERIGGSCADCDWLNGCECMSAACLALLASGLGPPSKPREGS